MDDFSLKCFGVGDGTASIDRNHSAYLYRLGTATLLVDCGEPVSRSFKATGLSYETIDRIFLSHLHSDHVGGLFMLLQGFWLEQRRQQLTIHLPGDAIQPIANMLNAAYLFPEVLPFPLRFEPLAAGQAISFADVQVTPYRTTHLDSLKKHFQSRYPGEYAAYVFKLSRANGALPTARISARPRISIRCSSNRLTCSFVKWPISNRKNCSRISKIRKSARYCLLI